MPQTHGESLRERLQLFHFPFCLLSHPSAFAIRQHFPFSKCCRYLHNCAEATQSVPLLSFSAAGSLFHTSMLIPQEHTWTVTNPLQPLTWHRPDCQVSDRSGGTPAPTSLSVPLLNPKSMGYQSVAKVQQIKALFFPLSL